MVHRACAVPSGTWVPPLFLDQPRGIDDDDPVTSGPDDAVLAQFAQHPYDDLPDRTDGLRQLPLVDHDHELAAFGHALGGQVEQVPSRRAAEPLPNALPEISAMKLWTRSLRSANRAMATRPSRAARSRATVGEIRTARRRPELGRSPADVRRHEYRDPHQGAGAAIPNGQRATVGRSDEYSDHP